METWIRWTKGSLSGACFVRPLRRAGQGVPSAVIAVIDADVTHGQRRQDQEGIGDTDRKGRGGGIAQSDRARWIYPLDVLCRMAMSSPVLGDPLHLSAGCERWPVGQRSFSVRKGGVGCMVGMDERNERSEGWPPFIPLTRMQILTGVRLLYSPCGICPRVHMHKAMRAEAPRRHGQRSLRSA